MPLAATLRQLRAALAAHRDLLVWWWLLVMAQALVPPDHLLGRADLLPWLMLTLAGAALLRARPLGDGPHPMLRARRLGVDAGLRRLGAVLAPAALLALHDAAWQRDAVDLVAGGLISGLLLLLRHLGRRHGATAWRPGQPRELGVAAALLTLGGAAALGLGGLRRFVDLPVVDAAATSALVGVGFVVVGGLEGRRQHLLQRRAAGRRDGRSWRPGLFPFLLALGGPAVGLTVLLGLAGALAGGLDFDQAFVGALFVAAWAAVVWAPPQPSALWCLLHEVVPVGGLERARRSSGALGFDTPPEGALRLDPLRVRRTRKVHPWLVPVHDRRIAGVDDPVRPLWVRPARPPASHILGSARAEASWGAALPRRLVLELGAGQELATLREGDVQARRLVVLRTWGDPTGERGRPTWRWERRARRGAVQVVDATTERISLEDGDIIVLSTEGVARAYEVELGEGLPPADLAGFVRVPQLEDYTAVGT